MHTKDEPLSIITFRDGAALEAIDAEIQKACDNIVDPNTTDVKRQVTVVIDIVPPIDGKSGSASMHVHFKTKLAPDKTLSAPFSIGANIHGKAEAFELIMQRQLEMPDNVRPIKKGDSGDGA